MVSSHRVKTIFHLVTKTSVQVSDLYVLDKVVLAAPKRSYMPAIFFPSFKNY